MRLRFGCAYNQDLNFKALSRHLLIPTLQAESDQTKAQTFFLPHDFSNFSPSSRGDAGFVDVGLLQTFKSLLHQTGSGTRFGAVSINDLAEQRLVPAIQPGQAGMELPVWPQQGREEWSASSKRAANCERRVEQLARGIHLGSHVPDANGHHLFVSVLVLLKQDEVGVVVFSLLSSSRVLVTCL